MPVMKRIRLVLAATLVAGAASAVTAAPAHACFNPDDPICRIGQGICSATNPVAKYRDKAVTCYP